MNPFEFATASRIVFGRGRARETGHMIRPLGTRALVVTGRDPGRAAVVIDSLRELDIHVTTCAVTGEPTVASAVNGAEIARNSGTQVVIGLGGGSAMDAAKAIAALATNPEDPFEYLEVIGKGRPLPAAPLPVVAVPTTAGTGAEVTRNAVLGSPKHRVKVSLRHAGMLPRVAVVDPELTVGLSPRLTASTGMDALTQLIEPFLSCRANPLTDGLCREGLALAAGCLRRAYDHGDDLDARSAMSAASLMGGLALANAGLGAVHGFAGPIGGMFPIGHGDICAALLVPVLEANLRALRAREPRSPALGKFWQLAGILSGGASFQPESAIDWARELSRHLGVAGISALGIRPQDHADIIAKARQASSMKANPIVLDETELAGILETAD